MFETADFGEVPYCGIPDGGARRPERGPGAGFMLVEVLVAVVLLGLVMVPLAALLTTTVRVGAATERRAERTALASTALSIVERVPVVDGCDAVELRAEVLERLTFGDGWELHVATDCATPPLVLVSVEVVDPRGESLELPGSRP